MSTPGSLTIVSKGTNQDVPATGPVDGGTLLIFVDTSIITDRFSLPVGDTLFSLELQATLSSTVASRPTWIQVELCRIRTDSLTNTVSYDTTGKSRRSIVQPGTTVWADTFNVPEYVDPTDGLFGWTVTHNGNSVRINVNIFKAKNEKANIIHRLGGYNLMSS